MSVNAVKIAISLPKDVIKEVEQTRHKMGLGRSQAILEAVSLWLKRKQEEALDKQYAEGYKKKPENAGEINPLFYASLSSFSKDKW